MLNEEILQQRIALLQVGDIIRFGEDYNDELIIDIYDDFIITTAYFTSYYVVNKTELKLQNDAITYHYWNEVKILTKDEYNNYRRKKEQRDTKISY